VAVTYTNFKSLVEVGPGFWNVRGSFKIVLGLVDIGTHMSVLKLNSGKFVIVDTIPLTPEIKTELDALTKNGELIEAVLATHPFHTLAFPAFHSAYPNLKYYGTPRHLRKLTNIKWVGDLNDCKVRSLWSPEIEMRIPAGSEFVAPMPEAHNHFSCVWVFHEKSKSIHIDDTVMVGSNPGILLKLAGFRHGSMSFHPSIKNVGLNNTPNAPFEFRDWVKSIIKDWDFDNICTAHMGNKVGGAKKQLTEVLEKAEPLFQKLSDRNKKSTGPIMPSDSDKPITVSGDECG
jgi:hypothetical protein